MIQKLYLLIIVSCLLISSCSSTKGGLNADADIQFNTSTVLTQDDREFHVLDTEVAYVTDCLADNTGLDAEELSYSNNSGAAIESRAIIVPAKPLAELYKDFEYFKVDYEVGVTPLGNVVMVRVVNSEGTITAGQAQRSALNLLNMKYESDPYSQCLAMGRYSIMVDGREVVHGITDYHWGIQRTAIRVFACFLC